MPAASVSIHSTRRTMVTRALWVSVMPGSVCKVEWHERPAPTPVRGCPGRAIGAAHGPGRVRHAAARRTVAGDADRRAGDAGLQAAGGPPGARSERRRWMAADREGRPPLAG